jgi:glyoxylase-like metal-dependent hydrolase (beta-lactamase superfamily II)
MKRLHRNDLWQWSAFQTHLNIDFNSLLWVRPEGNVVFDPLPLSDHDAKHLLELGGVKTIIVTNSRHVRAANEIAHGYTADVMGPVGEADTFPLPCARMLGEGDEPFPGLRAFALGGSKTKGELAFLLDETTLICGDLVRSHRAGRLQLLKPEQGMSDAKQAAAEVARLAAIETIEAVLVGDGFCEFRDGAKRLAELRDELHGATSSP